MDVLIISILLVSLLILVTLLVGAGVIIVKEARAKDALPSKGYYYHDNYLNFELIIPEGWVVAAPEESRIREIVQSITDGVVWDMRYHKLTQEVVPIALIQKIPESVKDADREKKLKYAKFMTLGFRGSDEDYSYLQDTEKLKQDFKTLLEKLEHKDVEIIEVTNLGLKGDKELTGILLKAVATYDDIKINYVQYYEPAGKNIMFVTYGSLADFKEQIKDIRKVLKYLVYLPGGVTAPAAIQEEMKKRGLPAEGGTLVPLDPNEIVVEVDDDHDEDGERDKDDTVWTPLDLDALNKNDDGGSGEDATSGGDAKGVGETSEGE